MQNKLLIFNKIRLNIIVSIVIITMLSSTSCSKLIETDPPFTSVNGDNAFNNDRTAIAAITGTLAQMSAGGTSAGGTNSNLYAYAGVASDELTLFSVDNDRFSSFYLNSLTVNSEFGFWTDSYNLIFSANAALKGLNSSTDLTISIKKQLLGEAMFIRAFCYFYLVNIYGNVPLVVTTDPNINASLHRNSVDEVYTQVINDLKGAQELLSKDFLSSNLLQVTTERVRPTYWAASALLARVYLYHKDYSLAASTSSEVINEASMFHLDSLDDVFLMNSFESIWQLQSLSNTGANTGEGNLFILPKEGPSENQNPVYLSRLLLNSFEENDKRVTHWMDSVLVDTTVYYYAYKYKSGASTSNGLKTEYQVVLRLGELYLIRAEANANLGNLQNALDDLNTIRRRAGLSNANISTKETMLSNIFHERQVELFTEWGHRWFDLKRTGNIDMVMKITSPIKGSNWDANQALWPLTQAELDADPNLSQNPGY